MTRETLSADLDITRPFLTRDALSAALTPKELRGPRFRTIFRGIHISTQVAPNRMQRVHGALLLFAHAPAVVSHHSAAQLLGIPVPDHTDVHITVAEPGQRRRRAGIRCHVQRHPRVIRRGGLLVSAPNQLFVELAANLTLVDLVIAGDHMVRQRLTDPGALIKFCRSTDLHHAGRALRAAKLVRHGVDSPMETRLRLLIVLAGLPEPQVNLVLRTADGEIRRKYDLSYPEQKVVIEYDGRHHVERLEQWGSDLRRREESETEEWRFVVLISADIFKTPGQTVERIWRVLRDNDVPRVPPRPRQDWQLHFPGR